MAEVGYVADDDLAMALHLALALGRPLLLEGAAGVGKTEVARVWAAGAPDARLIRLQCYEGLDASQAIYEWNYQRQLLAIRATPRRAVRPAPSCRGSHLFRQIPAEASAVAGDQQDDAAGAADRRDRPGG